MKVVLFCGGLGLRLRDFTQNTPKPLVLVRRVYVVPETWDQAASETVVEEPELWCVSCCSQYPHNVVADEESGDETSGEDGPSRAQG